jgi:hypothetical protein
MTLPDVVGPTDTYTVAKGDLFGGTSGATPNAAGAATAFWSSQPLFTAEAVRHLLFEKAAIFKDWGDAGIDNTFGHGGVKLHTYHADTVWVDRRLNNTTGLASLPYYHVSDAQQDAVAGGRVVYLGQDYPEPLTLDKELLHESIGYDAVLGD